MTITPSQGDRELFKELLALDVTDDPKRILAGALDMHPKMQIIALHAQAARIEGAKAMQEAAAKVCEAQQATFLSPEYATGQPLSSFGERFACGRCADAIRSLDPQTISGEAG